MRSRKRSPGAPDAGDGDDRDAVTESDSPRSRSGPETSPASPISEADADDKVAQAEARAEVARARVAQLRRAAETSDTDDDVSQRAEQRPAGRTRTRLRRLRRPRRPRWLRRPGRKTVAACVGVVLAAGSLGASGYMVWQHRRIAHNRQLTAEFAAAARQQVTMLMSIDANHAREDFQRILDASTGDLKSQMSVMAGIMAKQAEESKVSSTATVQAVAVESVSENSGVVLVAAKSEATGPDNAKRPPALFRLSVDLTRDGGQLKMSKVDFLQ